MAIGFQHSPASYGNVRTSFQDANKQRLKDEAKAKADRESMSAANRLAPEVWKASGGAPKGAIQKGMRDYAYGERPKGLGEGYGESAYRESEEKITDPGRRADYWSQNADQFQSGQDAASQYWNQAQGRFAEGSGAPADMSSYYENAFRQASEGINQSMAGQGLLNSSQTADLTAEVGQNLAAERALKEADYGLQRSADERNWAMGGGQLAQAAGRADLDRLRTGGGLAGSYDQMDRQGYESAIDRGMGLDQLRHRQEQDYIDNAFRPAEIFAPIAAGAWGQAFDRYDKFAENEAAGWTNSLGQRLAGEQDDKNQTQGGIGTIFSGIGAL